MRDSQVRDATEKIRLFVQAPLAAGAPLPLTGDQAHYLGGVRRLKVGDAILVFNGLDGEWRASVAELGRGAGRLVVSEKTRAQSSAPDVWLVQALIKRGPLELVAEKAVELGAARIQLVTTDYSQRRAANLRRLRAIAIEAAEQCGRLEVPEIAEAAALPLCLGEWPAERPLLHSDETGGGRPLTDVLADIGRGPAAILIGPEGGFSPAERAALAAARFATAVSLGPRILRAETAALSALALWQALAGDWRA